MYCGLVVAIQRWLWQERPSHLPGCHSCMRDKLHVLARQPTIPWPNLATSKRSLNVVPPGTEQVISLHLKNSQQYHDSAYRSRTASTTNWQPLSGLLNLLRLTTIHNSE